MSDHAVLTLRKHADKTTGTRVVRYVVTTDEDGNERAEKRLVNPATPGNEHEAWPLAGVSFCEISGETCDPPGLTSITSDRISEGVAEGWVTTEGATPVVRPAGASQDAWNSTQTGQPHLFIHYDHITFHTLEGDFTYRVVHQPDKYADHGQATYEIAAFDADDDTPVTPEVYEAGATRVDHFYVIELEG